MYLAAGIVLWMDGVNEFVAGTKATILILPKDAFGNNVSSISKRSESYSFWLSATSLDGSAADVLNITDKGWNQLGYLSIEFVVASSGNLLLHVREKNQTLTGSPLPFKAKTGDFLSINL